MDTAVSSRSNMLINNAGIFIPKPFTDYTTEDFQRLGFHDACSFSVRITVLSKAEE